MSEEGAFIAEHREIADTSAERFIPISSMSQLVKQTLAPRFDESGRLLPLEEIRSLRNSEYLRKPLPTVERMGLVVGPKNHVVQDSDGGEIRSGWGYNVKDALYSALTQKERVSLSATDIESLNLERSLLYKTLEDSNLYHSHFDSMTQSNDAIHINRATKIPDEGKDIAGNLRVYLHGGIEGIKFARRMIEEGAVFDYAKVWTPDLVEGSQSFRRDTPIFEAANLAQLQSIVDTLRKLKGEGELPDHDNDRQQPLVGLPVDGLPGVYVGQIVSGHSFNGMMEELFADPIHNAVINTTNQTPIHAGEKPPEGWFEKAAVLARQEAHSRAHTVGVNPQCHALLREQDPQPILNVLRQGA